MNLLDQLISKDKELERRLDNLDTQRWATVTALSPLSVRLDGEGSSVPAIDFVGALAIGNRVMCRIHTNQLFVTHKVGGAIADLSSYATDAELTTGLATKAALSHTHDDRYYTEAEITTALAAKAALSHTHTLTNITDFPSAVSATELGYLDGVTSALQTQLNGKQASGSYAAASHTHTLANVTDVTATAAELNHLDGIVPTVTELNYMDGVTSNVQTQLNAKLTASDTGWVNMTLATGSGTARYRVLNGVVYVQMSLTGATVPDSSTATDIVLAANGIPSQYRPGGTIYATCNFAGQFIGQALVQVTGAVSAIHDLGSTMSTVRSLITYPVGA